MHLSLPAAAKANNLVGSGQLKCEENDTFCRGVVDFGSIRLLCF